MTDTMTRLLSFIRTHWLAGTPCGELMNANPEHQDLILHWYARLLWAEWSKKP
jgi:hypothetical protein